MEVRKQAAPPLPPLRFTSWCPGVLAAAVDDDGGVLHNRVQLPHQLILWCQHYGLDAVHVRREVFKKGPKALLPLSTPRDVEHGQRGDVGAVDELGPGKALLQQSVAARGVESAATEGVVLHALVERKR
eukprot:CAMPEP_0171137624 /NCGR_PEP_ID=MMETSP0766_2-20121228/133666_1 /TAXON_ID=439317 /ORGANISM="Gambierdiscus australes, Strain CAWD 149" /LENGTH=128 /DNA_ID=CAMNT_0011601209 /DNA_START=115 /DNA_END=501 /DNA_ORIENTATION=-